MAGPRGITVGEFLSAIGDGNGELTYPIEIESNVRPVSVESPDGARIYLPPFTDIPARNNLC